MSARRRAALAAGIATVGALAAARPALDALVGRVERGMNPVGPEPEAPVSARARDVHATLRVADLHADSLLWGRDLLVRGDRGHVDVPRLIEGGIALQVLSMPVKTPRGINIERNADTSDQVLAIALAKRWPPATWRRLLPRVLYLGRPGAPVRGRLGRAVPHPPIAGGPRGLPGGPRRRTPPSPPACSRSRVPTRSTATRRTSTSSRTAGIRMISPAHFFDTAFGGSAHGLEQGGLTEKGREMVRRMEARGVILDVAHASARTIDDALAMATRPVVASHTGVRGVCDNARNLSDEHLDGIAATGGLVGIGFWETAGGGPQPADIARSIAYAIDASAWTTSPSARTGMARCRCRSTPRTWSA